MAKEGNLKSRGVISSIVNVVVWLTGILVSLAVGFGMADGVLTIKWLPEIVTIAAGYIVIALTILGVILAIADRI